MFDEFEDVSYDKIKLVIVLRLKASLADAITERSKQLNISADEFVERHLEDCFFSNHLKVKEVTLGEKLATKSIDKKLDPNGIASSKYELEMIQFLRRPRTYLELREKQDRRLGSIKEFLHKLKNEGIKIHIEFISGEYFYWIDY